MEELINEIQKFLEAAGYSLVYTPPCIGETGFAKKVKGRQNIYGGKLEHDFMVYAQDKTFIIEGKYQKSPGSVDEKFPYLVENIKTKHSFPTVIVLEGGGYKKTAEAWLRKQVGGMLIGVFSLGEFKEWINQNL